MPPSSSQPALERRAARTASAARPAVPTTSPPLRALDDGRLVLLCRGGDEQAWRVLVHRYRALVHAVPARMGLPQEEVEEVFLETFARLVQWVGRMEEPHRVRAWLVTTARRLGLDAVERRRRWSMVPLDGERGADPAEAAPERLEREDRADRLHRALKRLERRCRDLLERLYPARGRPAQSYRAISQATGLPMGSIGPTRARCLQKLLVEYRRAHDPTRRRGCTPRRWS